MIRFMCLLFQSLVTATFAIVAVHFVRVVNIGFAVLRHFKGYSKLDTCIEVPEGLSDTQVTTKKRLDKELYTFLLRFPVIKNRFGIRRVMQVEQTEIYIGRKVHTHLVGVETELLMLEHVSDTSADLNFSITRLYQILPRTACTITNIFRVPSFSERCEKISVNQHTITRG